MQDTSGLYDYKKNLNVNDETNNKKKSITL